MAVKSQDMTSSVSCILRRQDLLNGYLHFMVSCPCTDLRELVARGWGQVQFSDSSESTLRREMLSLGAQLGTPLPVRTGRDLFTILTPTATAAARPNSLSHRFAHGEFELHNDTAHWVMPCRYILLACLDSGGGGRPTIVLDTKTLPLESGQLELLHTAPVRVTNGRRSFYSTILSRGRDFVRFDVGCMTSGSASAAVALQVLKKQNWPQHVQEFHWKPGIGLVIDNWRVLHGRGSAVREDATRKLLRISFL